MDYIIRMHTSIVVNKIEDMYKPIINITDANGVSIDDFVRFYDETGDKIMHTGEISPNE
jgi:hypothetical protein